MKRKWTRTAALLVGFAVLGASQALGSTVFSDDFNLANGSPVDSSKWQVDVEGTSTVLVDAGTGNGKVDLQAKSPDWSFRSAWMTSKVGGDFLSSGSEVIYSAKVWQTGSSDAASMFGIKDVLQFESWATGDWAIRNAKLMLGATQVWAGTWDSTETVSPNLTIAMTPTTYSVSLANTTTTSGSLSGTHSTTASDGTLWFRSFAMTPTWTHTYVDDVSINHVPEPSLIGIAVSGLFGLLAYAWRKRK